MCLDLWWGDVSDVLADLAARSRPLVDAWYLDGFAPSRNESMWQPQLWQAVAALSRPGASFATFTAAGHVRRGLAAAGFRVRKIPGYGRKRESLGGQLATPVATTVPYPGTPWDLPNASPPRPEQALVIGGGLAGCTAAAALARRGLEVTLLDSGALAGAGSSNDQGILYTRLSPRHSLLTDFALQSFLFAVAWYRELFRSGALREGLDGALCGSFHQGASERELAELAPRLADVPELASVLDARAASQLIGIDQSSEGYWFPGSGWLRPGAVCQAISNHPRIRVRQDCGEISLDRESDQWLASAGGRELARAPCAIVATGAAVTGMNQLQWLPLRAIRGQTTQLPTASVFADLRAALCHRGYIAPPREGEHCIGATFVLDDASTDVRAAEHRSNLDKLAAAVPAWREYLDALDVSRLQGRVAHRCASPDYLPVVGPVPDHAGFLRDYAGLRKNARQTIHSRGDYMPGLYLSAAHGSRGLTSTPLAAELLASQICGEPPPLARPLCRALAPARFIIRDLGRHRLGRTRL